MCTILSSKCISTRHFRFGRLYLRSMLCIANPAEPEVIIDIWGSLSFASPSFLASRKSLYVTTISQAILSLCVPVGFLLSSLSQTFENPGTSIFIVGVAGNFGLSAGNSGFIGSFSEAICIEFSIFFSFAVRYVMYIILIYFPPIASFTINYILIWKQ